jgi:hypothetical protein
VDDILNIITPTTAKQVHHIICLAGYYQKFIKDFAKISKLIYIAVYAEIFIWIPECQKAFNKIKDKFTKFPVLAHSNFEKPFEIECDASKIQIEMILSQKDN